MKQKELHPRLLTHVHRIASLEGVRDKLQNLLQQHLGPDYSETHTIYTALVGPYEEAIAKQRFLLQLTEQALLPRVGRQVIIRGQGKQQGVITWTDGLKVAVRDTQKKKTQLVASDKVEVVL